LLDSHVTEVTAESIAGIAKAKRSDNKEKAVKDSLLNFLSLQLLLTYGLRC